VVFDEIALKELRKGQAKAIFMQKIAVWREKSNYIKYMHILYF